MRARAVTDRALALCLALLVILSTSGCGGGDPALGKDGTVRLKLGYFPNLTHATALLGAAGGAYQRALGEDVRFETAVLNAGPEAVEALFSGAIDAAFIGPSPTISAHAVSFGEAVRVVAGATSGGAFFVVRPEIDTADDLRGRTVASPQLGNTQDVALRAWLAEQGLATDLRGGGDVQVQPQAGAQILEAYRAGAIDGAWVPEPWATRLVREAGAKVLVDEADLWPGGRFVTTHLIVRADYLARHPDQVRTLIEAHVQLTDWANGHPQEAARRVNAMLGELTGKPLPEPLLNAAWANLELTVDPIAGSLRETARAAERLGLIETVDLDGLYDLTLLNEVLAEAGKPEVAHEH